MALIPGLQRLLLWPTYPHLNETPGLCKLTAGKFCYAAGRGHPAGKRVSQQGASLRGGEALGAPLRQGGGAATRPDLIGRCPKRGE